MVAQRSRPTSGFEGKSAEDEGDYSSNQSGRERFTKTVRKSAHQQRCRPHTACGGNVEHQQIPRASPGFRLLQRSPRNQDLFGVNGAYVNKTLHKSTEEEV
ncbi:hypothetical protein TNCV_3095831 [Trichonephila clavipes]|nr:hypothetical protein TNCV_3095831 [Trichonephila clavipes]